MKSRRMLALAAIVVSGFILRILEIGRWPLWGDEAMTLLIAQYPLKTLFLQPVDPTPGLYYALHKLFLRPLVDAPTARTISLVCGTLLIPATYLLAKEARVPALLSAALVALSFPLIDFSQEARAYALVVLLVVLSAYFFVRWSRSRKLGDLLATLLLNVLAYYTHLVSVFWIGPIVIAILILGQRQTFLPLILTAVLAAPETLRILRYPDDGFVWLAQATPEQAADTLAKALLPFLPDGAWLILAALLIGWRCWVRRQALAGWAKDNTSAAIVLAILLVEPLAVWLLGLVTTPIYMTRTVLMAVPGVMLAISLLLQSERYLARFGVVVLYAGSLLVTGTTRHKEEWDVIADKVGSDTVLLCLPRKASAMRAALSPAARLILRYDNGLAEIAGQPWPIAYFKSLTSKEEMTKAHSRADSLNRDLYPVWPVKSGLASDLSPVPTSLGAAEKACTAFAATLAPTYGWPNN